MQREIITTADGSKTIQIKDWNEQYHSKHGAIQEAYHVFINYGLNAIDKKSLSILEIGFGTGLNALITLIESDKNKKDITYKGVEAYPVSQKELQQLNYIEQLGAQEYANAFNKMHTVPWEKPASISPIFHLTKCKADFKEIVENDQFELVYFDAFGARVQPELWTEEIFQLMFRALKSKGVLVTYAAKGSVRRAMLSVGFLVEKLPGPPGKREMLRATKP